MHVCSCHRCRRFVTTASAEVIGLSVAHGGVTALLTPTACVTHLILEDSLEGTVAMISRRIHTQHVLGGTFAIWY